jgi:predicted ester cyclase
MRTKSFLALLLVVLFALSPGFAQKGNKATMLANRFFNEVASDHNVAVLDEILHPAFQAHQFPALTGSDKAGFTAGMKGFLSAFPDIKITIHQQFSKGDKVFTYAEWTGTHKGTFQGIAPTNKKVKVEFMDIWREEGGKTRENWVVMDIMGLMMQLGAVPPPGGK